MSGSFRGRDRIVATAAAGSDRRHAGSRREAFEALRGPVPQPG
ncbi:hypothetical protein BZL30_6793 [Mycobacterium kansasii]|uniref:Uncharacterized protein n=1 Tax=Mycobacterium kansasii TaxID=1768 RepID=A0A1V3WQ73_MYCKA|nr:hypothetical protein BZL30_6793 [Mycobacterium kansasii]